MMFRAFWCCVTGNGAGFIARVAVEANFNEVPWLELLHLKVQRRDHQCNGIPSQYCRHDSARTAENILQSFVNPMT